MAVTVTVAVTVEVVGDPQTLTGELVVLSAEELKRALALLTRAEDGDMVLLTVFVLELEGGEPILGIFTTWPISSILVLTPGLILIRSSTEHFIVFAIDESVSPALTV